MKTVLCPVCGRKLVKNGYTSSGRQRWRCLGCGSSQTVRYDTTATRLEEFLSWLLSQGTLFTYLDPDLTREGPLPATNNRIEGG